MIREACGAKLMERKSSFELRKMLGVKEEIEWLAKAKWSLPVCAIGHVLRRKSEDVFQRFSF